MKTRHATSLHFQFSIKKNHFYTKIQKITLLIYGIKKCQRNRLDFLKMKEIHQKNRWYNFLRPYVDRMSLACFSRYRYTGRENIPDNAAVIYAPNHSQALMDALVVLAIDKSPKVFVARADIFKKPTIRKILWFLKMLPINRMRDGRESLQENERIANQVVKALREDVSFCILPEGTHQAANSLLPLRKGLFRIALQANADFGDKKPVYIVPVGITFGNYFRYLSTMLCQIGTPINVTEFVKNHPQKSEAELINELRDILTQKLKENILYIPHNENYTGTMELCHICNQQQIKALHLDNHSLKARLMAARTTVKQLQSAFEKSQQSTQNLIDRAKQFYQKRKKAGIGFTSILLDKQFKTLIINKLWLLLGLPYFIFSFFANLLLMLVFGFTLPGIKDKAFVNSFKVVLQVIFIPLTILLTAVLSFVFLKWYFALIITVLCIPSAFYLFYYVKWIKTWISDVKWLLNKELQKEYFELAEDAMGII
jgi:1-acyl-sn-glycerol-3-phosphate acyltransferase